MPIDTLDCTVQMCGFPALDVAPMEQGLTKEDMGKVEWSADSQSNYTTSAASAVCVYSQWY